MRRRLRGGSRVLSSGRHRRSLRMGAVAAAFAAIALTGTARGNPVPETAVISASGGLSLANSREGSAILSGGGLAPGRSATGTVTVRNTGDAAGDLFLSTSGLTEIAGPRGGALSARIAVAIEDVTRTDAPVAVRVGGLALSTPLSLGTLGRQEARTYRFTASLPDGGTPPDSDSGDNRYQGASVSVTYDWTVAAPEASPAPAPQPAPSPPSPSVPPAAGVPTPTAPARSPRPLTTTLAAARRQRVRGITVLKASAKCSQSCRLTTKAEVRGLGARPLTLRGRTLTLPSQAAGTVSFKGSQAAVAVIRRALARRRAVTVDVIVTGTGASGTQAFARATVELRP
jgi:hypothetical protein